MRFLTITLILICHSFLCSQDNIDYGSVHPDAPAEASDWQPLIGTCECQSVLRNTDGTWQDTTQLTWIWKYIMKGKAVQDQSFGKVAVLPQVSDNIYRTAVSGMSPFSVATDRRLHRVPGLEERMEKI